MQLMSLNTHTGAAQADDGQGLQDAGSADNPGETQKQDDTQNILKTGEVDTHEGPHLRALQRGVRRERKDNKREINMCTDVCLYDG